MDIQHIKREAIAGVTTFFTMAYIVFVNPSILATPGTGMSFSGVLTATVLLSFLMTLFMGLYAKLPFAVAPGMGINAFFTFSLILGQQIPWPVALGMVFWAGVLFIIISVTPIRIVIANAIPKNIRIAAAAGIGIFLTFIGMKNAGLVVADPVTFVKLGAFDKPVVLSLIGLVISLWFLHRKNSLAFIAGILATTAIAAAMGMVSVPQQVFSPPDFESVLFKLDIWGALQLSLLPAMISIMFTDLFDSISTFVGVSHATGLVDENGQAKNLKEGLIVDAVATMGAGLAGTSSGTAFIESSAGIEMGGRTGLTSVFTALCFLPCLFVAPLVGMVPAYATAPVLILVGALMFKCVSELSLKNLEDVVPAFLVMVLIPLTFSITQGILWGFVTHVIMYYIAGRRREIPWMLHALAVISVGLLVLARS
ncbi:MAG: purP [Pseudobdellovibrio sp.]|jgi:AGZA family xanthine/uracil permease-like MFS transporter|nr:purP [Pseudobdellovibrio sp.]